MEGAQQIDAGEVVAVEILPLAGLQPVDQHSRRLGIAEQQECCGIMRNSSAHQRHQRHGEAVTAGGGNGFRQVGFGEVQRIFS